MRLETLDEQSAHWPRYARWPYLIARWGLPPVWAFIVTLLVLQLLGVAH